MLPYVGSSNETRSARVPEDCGRDLGTSSRARWDRERILTLNVMLIR
jgi:hypothetical protein